MTLLGTVVIVLAVLVGLSLGLLGGGGAILTLPLLAVSQRLRCGAAA